MNGSESGRHKGLALAVAVCFFLAAPAPASAATFPGQTVETTVLVPVGINVLSELQLGRVLAPTPGGSPTVFFVPFTGDTCDLFFGNGECMTGAPRSSGSLELTGTPFTTVSFSDNVPRPATPSIVSAGVDCTGGTGATPVRVTNIFFSNTFGSTILASNGKSALGVGAWFAVWDTSQGAQTCAYSVTADY